MIRPLTPGEIALAESVFGDAIDYSKVRLANLWPSGFAVTFWSWIVFPLTSPVPPDFAVAPAHLQAWLVHELTHVWQFQTAQLRTLRSWAGVVMSGGYGPGLPGYRYRLPLPDWEALNLEQQASVVEHAFLFRKTGWCRTAPHGATFAALALCAPFEALRGSP